MSFSFSSTHFFNDLVDKNIQQGQEYIKVNRIFSDSGNIHIKPLQLTSAPYLSSISEAMNGGDSTNSMNTDIKTNISGHEDEFNKTLVKYSSLYNAFSEDVLNNNNNNLQGNINDKQGNINDKQGNINDKQGNINDKQANINPYVWQQLSVLNNKLIDLAAKINNEISSLTVTDSNLKTQLVEQQKTLSNYINQLKNEKGKLNDTNNSSVNVDGLQQNSQLVLVSNKYYYLVWFILGLTIIAMSLYSSTSNKGTNILLVIVSLLALYFISKWINERFIRQ